MRAPFCRVTRVNGWLTGDCILLCQLLIPRTGELALNAFSRHEQVFLAGPLFLGAS